ncbi:LysM peptidoglycan-binding domain-containing protein [Evansella sp. LMS18]|uniref:LysM peptidoglycan-binding domain-containing protein n=1 Tax=Evansella sp. LMS18 TaxID=2924033 RepID=UPI0020D08CA5|nr:LysM peptidoglycan-binding domain-containing protein [Evansella sp. LMS18]UTR12318.1 LysM peptidoglycan-binding domain-containing protein [Evansella sp. LMS18]
MNLLKEVPRLTKNLSEKKKNLTAWNIKILPVMLGAVIAAAGVFPAALSVKAEGNAYTVQAGDTLFSIADQHGTSVNGLKEVNGLRSDLIITGQTLQLADSNSQDNVATSAGTEYSVSVGDTLYSIAGRYGTTVEEIQTANGLSSTLIYPGQTLQVGSEQQAGTKENKTEGNSESDAAVYTVQKGDTLWNIASRFDTTVKDIQQINGLSGTTIYIGQELITGKAETVTEEATVVGAADSHSVEFHVNGEPLVLKVGYGEAEEFQKMRGEEVEITYEETGRPSLVSYEDD